MSVVVSPAVFVVVSEKDRSSVLIRRMQIASGHELRLLQLVAKLLRNLYAAVHLLHQGGRASLLRVGPLGGEGGAERSPVADLDAVAVQQEVQHGLPHLLDRPARLARAEGRVADLALASSMMVPK